MKARSSFNNTLMTKINRLDLTDTRNRLYVKKGWTMDVIHKAIESYRRFLYLCVEHPTISFAPTEVVDEVWHDHILHTADYITDCGTIADEIIHHHPHPTSPKDMFEEKKDAPNPNFIEYHKKIWGGMPYGVKTATCDKCTYETAAACGSRLAGMATCDKCTNGK